MGHLCRVYGVSTQKIIEVLNARRAALCPK